MFSAPKDKHVACSRCRERKVKCDGQKPCRRCQRNGSDCQYIRGKKQRPRSEWLQHLRTFSAQPNTVDPTRSSGGLLTCAPDREESISAQSLVHSSTMPYYSQGANSMSPCTFATGTPRCESGWETTEPHRTTAQWLPDLTITATEQANSTPQPYASTPDAEFFASDYNSIYISAPVYTSFNPQLDDSGIAPTPWRSTTPFSQASEDSSTCYTTTNPGHLDPGLAWRSNTPFSQASEEAPIDGLLDPSICFTGTFYPTINVRDRGRTSGDWAHMLPESPTFH